MTTTATCVKCAQPFEYERSTSGQRRMRGRVVCPDCQAKTAAERNQRRKAWRPALPTEEPADHLYKAGLLGISQADLAYRMGVTEGTVMEIERKALAKIRKHPEALQLFALWKAEGTPTPGPQPEAGELILDWQAELDRWREAHEILSDPEEGCPEEAAEMGKEIEVFAAALRWAIQKLRES